MRGGGTDKIPDFALLNPGCGHCPATSPMQKIQQRGLGQHRLRDGVLRG
jgi:hypothetical protein